MKIFVKLAILNIKRNHKYIQNIMQKSIKQIFEPGKIVKIRISDIDKLKMQQRSCLAKLFKKA
ncbi:hypothetical protein C2G38_2115895 [Gigaspora rosea]|uniref:Uncharacterized protein n=1 Tax=Gigaspora rosea TaxID=44941 RepID=A0A397UCL0_9GLOM|nr:hypothetical protein C2G38_2115895 [Gigaspora rosea]